MAGILQIKRGVVGVGSLNDGEFYLNKGINAVQIGSGSAILTLLPLNQTVTGDIILNGNIYANNLNITSSYALSSSYSQYAATASYIIAAGTSTSASYANTASFILSTNVYGPAGFNSVLTSSFAITASYAPGYLQSSATQSMLNGYILSTQTSSFVINSQTSSMYVASASNATSSSYASTASFVPNALYSASINANVIQFLSGDGTTHNLIIDTGSILVGSLLAGTTSGQILYNNGNVFGSVPNITYSGTTLMVSGSLTGSLFGTSSWAESSSKSISASVAISASYSLTSSFSSQSRTADVASYITSSNVYGPNGFNSILTSSYANTASLAYAIVGGASTVSSSYPFNVTGSTIYSFNSNRLGVAIYDVPSYQNIIIGESAAASASLDTTGSIFFGNFAGYRLKRSEHVIYIGENSGQSTLDVTGSAFIGYNAGTSTKATFSNFIGYNAGSNAVLASNSNFLGYNTGRGAISASYSTLIGYQTGYRTGSGAVGIGTNNIIIGTNITLDDRRSDSINIGGILFGTGSYSNINGRPYSGSAGGRIGINVPNPTANLHVSGTIKLQNLITGSYPWVVTYDSASGELFYTASSAIGGGGAGGSVTGGQTNYLPLWSSSTTLTSSIAIQQPAGLQFNTPSVNVNDLFDWYGYNDVIGSSIGTINDFGYTIVSSTTSSLVLDGDITYGGTYPLPQTWSNIQLTDNASSVVSITDSYYSDISSITFYSQSYNGSNYTVFYSSSIVSGKFLPNYIYTSVAPTEKSIYVSGGLTVSASNIFFPNIETVSTVKNVLLYNSTNGKLYHNTLDSIGAKGGTISGSGQTNYIPLWSGSSALSSSRIYELNGNIGIGITTPLVKLDISGSTIIRKENTPALTLVGSGSTDPIFVVYGSQGELFSITDSLSGSLFSVHDISGLPVIESFSDATTLIGNYEAPALYTTIKKIINTGVGQVVYQVPTASYDGVFYDYTVSNGANARSGQVIARHLSGSVNLAEIATPDFGDTIGFDLGVIITGSYMALTGSATTDGWSLKTIIRSI